MKEVLKNCKALLILVVFFIYLAYAFEETEDVKTKQKRASYRCDVKNFTLNTHIDVYQGERQLYMITGNIFTFVEDPLTMYAGNSTEKKIAYADDTYHLIKQDSHTITTSGNSDKFELVGEITLIGNSYSIYNGKTLVATAKFNDAVTSGEIRDSSNKLIASYKSGVLANDYNVEIANNDVLSDPIILMICASYYSDQNYDNSVHYHHHSSDN